MGPGVNDGAAPFAGADVERGLNRSRSGHASGRHEGRPAVSVSVGLRLFLGGRGVGGGGFLVSMAEMREGCLLFIKHVKALWPALNETAKSALTRGISEYGFVISSVVIFMAPP